MVRGPPQGYFPELTKSILVLFPRNVPQEEAFFFGYELEIITGSRYLGGFVVKEAAQACWIEEKGEGWRSSLDIMASTRRLPMQYCRRHSSSNVIFCGASLQTFGRCSIPWRTRCNRSSSRPSLGGPHLKSLGDRLPVYQSSSVVLLSQTLLRPPGKIGLCPVLSQDNFCSTPQEGLVSGRR